MSKIVKRTLDFIELFAEHGRPLSLSEISKLLSIPVSSCHDVLQSLQERGYIYELGLRGGYYPTLKLYDLSSKIVENDPVIQRAGQRLRELRDRLDESVSLARIDGAQATYLLVLEPSYPLRFLVRVGDNVRSLYATSAGKAVLGSMAPDACDALIDKLDMVPLTEKTIRDKVVLKREVRESRERGWYVNREERMLTATTLSATFRWSRSIFIVTIAGPSFRIEPKIEELAAELQTACGDLERPGLSPRDERAQGAARTAQRR